MTDESSVVEWLDCPECGLPAFVADRFAVRSTDGPVPHAVIVCARLHRLCATESDLGALTRADPGRGPGRGASPPGSTR
jgi:hypothetical protein